MSDNTQDGPEQLPPGDAVDHSQAGAETPLEDVVEESDHDPGLTGQLRALRLEELSEHTDDEPMWGFERAEHGAQNADADRSESQTGEVTLAPESEKAESGVVEESQLEPEQHLEPEPEFEPEESSAEEAQTPAEEEHPEPEESSAEEEHPEPEEAEPAPEPPDVTSEEGAVAAEPDLAVEPDQEVDDAVAAAATVPAAAPPDEVAEPRQIDLGPERRSRGWLWGVASIVVLAAVGAASFAWWWTTSRPLSVPDVVGKRPGEATQALNDAGLRLGDLSETATSMAPPGTVIAQRPAAGQTLQPGGRVALTLSAAPDTATVPDLSATTRDEAERTLARVRLRPYVVRSYSTTAAADAVVAQVPVGGEELPAGSTVAIVVSRGPQPASVVVPKVAGLNETEAVRLVTASDLRPAVYRSVDPSAAAGVVTEQTPAARATVAPQATVMILVSQGKGATPRTVPNVVGMSREAAAKAIKNARLKSSANNVPSKSVPRGKVISQMPRGGTKSASNGVVGVLVSSGNSNTAPAPSLVGTDTAGADAAVRSAGFAPFVIKVEVSGRTPGLVFAQFPSPGTQYQRHFPVIALVAGEPAE